ncbi:hypothetical protein B566_EDAN012938 [Ephemera danica]|nr:hypothetical protein B566_EDAN012938 [Ephemera danica]
MSGVSWRDGCAREGGASLLAHAQTNGLTADLGIGIIIIIIIVMMPCMHSRSDLALGLPWKRFPKLTSYLGGFRRGELTILTGPTGCGKTTFMSEFSLDLVEQGVNTMWGSFEIRNARLARTMLTQLAGENLEKNMERFEEVADLMETLPLHFMAFHGQQPLKKVMEAVEHATYVHDLGHIVIDNVQFMLGVEQMEKRYMNRFHMQDVVIDAFRNHATSTNCHVTLVMHPRKAYCPMKSLAELAGDLLSINSIYGSAKASQDADNVLILQDHTSFPGGRRFIQVTKNRYNGILGNMALIFDRDSMCYNKKKKGDPVKGVFEGDINVTKPNE